MNKIMKSVIIYLLVMFVAIESNVIQADAAENIQAGDEAEYAIGYVVPAASTYSFTEEGGVTTNGLNLRKEPNINSTILEKMYFGELVRIDLDNSTMTFYYVERDKTGTKGYASREYIQILQYVR
ncbi:MAG: SH3 domain-containing protein [Lachnospiraceae bacterium]|nr:SH3 domain-containing protein [Lachnospiraceae bacterium]